MWQFIFDTIIKKVKYNYSKLQITVSSGGMYTQKLDVENIQNLKGNFDGTFVYAQNKRQQVCGDQIKKIYSYSGEFAKQVKINKVIKILFNITNNNRVATVQAKYIFL